MMFKQFLRLASFLVSQLFYEMNRQTSPGVGRSAAYLTRDQRLQLTQILVTSKLVTETNSVQVFILHQNRFGCREIAGWHEMKYNKARTTVRSGRSSPQSRLERPRVLSSEYVDELKAFVCSTWETCQIDFLEPSLCFSQYGVGELVIRNASRERVTNEVYLDAAHPSRRTQGQQKNYGLKIVLTCKSSGSRLSGATRLGSTIVG